MNISDNWEGYTCSTMTTRNSVVYLLLSSSAVYLLLLFHCLLRQMVIQAKGRATYIVQIDIGDYTLRARDSSSRQLIILRKLKFQLVA